jgi:DNA polymerase-1
VDLLKQYGTLEKVLEAAVDGKVSGKKGEVIRSQVEQARLSARLVTLKDDCDVMPEPEHLRYRFQVSDECAALLVKFDFHSLLKKWHPIAQKHSVEPEKTVEPALRAGLDAFRTVDKHDAFAGLLAALERSGEFALDLETTSLNPRDAAIVGFSFSYDPSFGVYVPVGHRGTDAPQLSLDFVLSELKPLLENPRIKKIGQNFKYDLSVLAQHGIQLRGIGADTMVASYVLDPEGRHNLETLAARHFGYKVLTYEEVCGDLSFDLISIPMATRYSAEDAWVTLNLWHVLRDKIQAEGLMEIFAKVDLPLVPVLARMESEGVCIDEPWLRQLGRDFERALLAIDQKVQAYSKSGPLNLNSPKQLGRLLFEELQLPVQSRTKTGYSTDASVLEALAPLHEVPRMLLEYREISKLKGTYVDPLPGMRDPKTGRIHASFHQAVTATGRLSSSDPNLQNIPIRTERGKLIRRAFIARSENVLLSADYSQIELRLLAHMSGDAELLSAFKNDDDVHRRTAAEIFGVASDAVTEQQRGFAKAINFGLMYGKTAFGLAQELKIGRREAQDMITRYFERYSGVKAFLDKQVADARERGWTVTLLGRKRYLPDINNRNAAMRTNAERMAMNAPIQGTAADLMKLAMIEIDERLHREGYSSRLMVQVHDEVVLDCPKTEVAAVTKLVVESMEQAMTLDVPLKVNAATGLNWMEL